MSSRDDEIRAVVAEVDALLGDLKANVDALAVILAGGGQQEEGAPA